MARLELFLLGTPKIESDGQPIHLETRKATAILAYLSIAGEEQSRDTLAALFWPESARARAALRRTLWALNKTIGKEWFQIEQESLALRSKVGFWLDVDRFHSNLAACQTHGHPSDEICPACLVPLTEAVELYRGDFMAGFSLKDSSDFDAWQSFQAESLHCKLTAALQKLIYCHSAQGDVELAITYARRWLALDPLCESAHYHLMQLYAQTGQRAAALNQYQAYVQILQKELALSPGEETTQLWQAIRDDRDLPPLTGWARSTHLCNLPPPPTPLVGRTEALSEIRQLLQNPNCRLLTLTGPGGIGKTHLALQAAAEPIEAFPHGVFFVPLAPLDSVDFVVSTIGETLGLLFQASQDPKTQLLNYLRGKKLLLLMDNFEHLSEAAHLVEEILQVAPEVKILATSRERLRLQEEWTFVVRGLRFPQHGDVEDVEDVEDYSAVQLFAQAARRVHSTFQLEKPHVARICQLLDGTPLAIKLAAAWVRAISCQEIAREIERDIDFLTTCHQNVPQRHHSLRAVFDHSWNLLSVEEKKGYKRLAVFRGGFRKETAEQITDVSLALLAKLIDKSLLHKDASDRYEIPQVLKQYALEKLKQTPQEEQEIRDRHCQHFLSRLCRLVSQPGKNAHRQASRTIDIELKDVHLAWRWAAEQAREDQIERYCDSLYRIYLIQSRFQQGERAFAAAAENLSQSQQTSNLVWKLRARQGIFRYYLGQPERAKECLQKSLRFFDALEDKKETTFCLLGLADIAQDQGDYESAWESAEAALAQATDCQAFEADSLYCLGRICRNQGKYKEAETYHEQALHFYRRAGDQWGESRALVGLGNVHNHLANYAKATLYYEQALRIKQELGDRQGKSIVLINLSVIHSNQGKYSRATSCCEQALRISREIGDQRLELAARNNLGSLFVDQGAYDKANACYTKNLQIHRDLGSKTGEGITLSNLGSIAIREGNYTKAKGYLNQSLDIRRETGDQMGEGYVLDRLSLLYHRMGNYHVAREYGQGVLQIAHDLDASSLAGYALTHLGRALEGLRQLPEAATAYQEALILRRKLDERHLALESLAGLASVQLAQGNAAQALTSIEEILDHLQVNALEGTDEPFQTCLICYHVLCANQDPRAQPFLGTVYDQLQERAAKISDVNTRRAFLENVVAHRVISDKSVLLAQAPRSAPDRSGRPVRTAYN